MPALPLEEAGKYVAAAYVVFFALILVYVAIMASKLVRIERQIVELVELADSDEKARRERRASSAQEAGSVAGAGNGAPGISKVPIFDASGHSAPSAPPSVHPTAGRARSRSGARSPCWARSPATTRTSASPSWPPRPA